MEVIDRKNNKSKMGSIDKDTYKEMVDELKNNLNFIIQVNQHIFKNSLKMNKKDLYSQWMGYLEVPKDCRYINNINVQNYTNYNSFGIWIVWNHYILLEFSHEQMRNKLVTLLKKQYGNKMIPLQRKWREYYYHPEGPFMKNHGKEMAKKHGMAW